MSWILDSFGYFSSKYNEQQHNDNILDKNEHIFSVDAERIAPEPAVDYGDPVGHGLHEDTSKWDAIDRSFK